MLKRDLHPGNPDGWSLLIVGDRPHCAKQLDYTSGKIVAQAIKRERGKRSSVASHN
jgi:hypothetical protein